MTQTIEEVLHEHQGWVREIKDSIAKRGRAKTRLLGEAKSLELTLSQVDWNRIDPVQQTILAYRISNLEERVEAFKVNTEKQMATERVLVGHMKSVIAQVQKHIEKGSQKKIGPKKVSRVPTDSVIG